MSTFNFDNQSVYDSGSITRSISESFYRNGEIKIKNTSQSEAGPSRTRTLTTRSLSEALSGDVLFTSLKSSNVAMNQLLDSSINKALTGFSEAGFTTGSGYTIPNPENINSTAKLTGGAAVARNISESIAGKKLMEGFVRKAAANISADSSTYNSYPAPGEHQPTSYTPDGTNISGGSRVIALESNMTADEKTWLTERATILKNTGNINGGDTSGLVNGFSFDIPDDLTTIYATKTYYPGVTDSSAVPSEIIKASSQKAYVCPALIELMIYLSSKIQIRGGFGLYRATDQSKMGPNISPLADGDSITDHALGRGFDIVQVGDLNGTLYNLESEGPTNPDVYRSGLEVFLTALSGAPSHLLPDFIAMSILLQAEYGILDDGFEPDSVIIKTKFPNLKYINFNCDATHKNHIHMSFSGGRSGVYTGPSGAMSTGGSAVPSVPQGSGPVVDDGFRKDDTDASSGIRGTSSSGAIGGTTTTDAGNSFITFVRKTLLENPFGAPATGEPGSIPGAVLGSIAITGDLADTKFTSNYSTSSSSSLTGPELFQLLSLTVMSPEAAALFCIIGGREGGARPAAVNINKGSGDWSFGMFQINLKTDSGHGKKTFDLPLPSLNRVLGWQLAFKDWQANGINDSNFMTEAFNYAEGLSSSDKIALFDPNVFIPINQSYMLHTVIRSQPFSGIKLGSVVESGYIFSPWGDYGGGPPYGWITNLRFSAAVELYQGASGTEQQLKQWVLDVYEKDPSAGSSKSAEYISDWVEGYYYPAGWDNGWVIKDIEAP